MRKTFFCFIYLFVFILCIVFISYKTTNSIVFSKNTKSSRNTEKKEISAIAPIKEIPILAWYGVQEHTVERYCELKEAGINYNLTFFTNVNELDIAMDVAKTTEVKMIIHCPELNTEPEKIINRFKDHPALAGYYLKDEPNRRDFHHLGELVRKIQAIDNKHFCYINLYPNYATSKQLGTTTYLEHVQLFLKEVPVPILSFDHYPIQINVSGIRSMKGEWYQNLEIISKEATIVGIPFWAFALTSPHWAYPIPTLSDLRLQIFSNLAYGAQGIQYYTYFTPEPVAYNYGPISRTYEKTEIWYTVQQMNREIIALSSVFLGAQVIKVEHMGLSIPAGTTRFKFDNLPAEAKNIIKEISTPINTNALVSFLKNDNRCYMVVINRNLEGGDNVTFKITGGAELQLIKKDGTAVPASSVNSSQTITPGDALIYGWDIK